MIKTDITIIGSGPGGYEAAIYAAKKGLKVVLVEKEQLGGTCLNWGCIPTKSFVKSASFFDQVKKASSYGITIPEASFNLSDIVDRKNQIVNQLQKGVHHLLKKNNVTFIQGEALFHQLQPLMVKTHEVTLEIESEHIILAMGSEPMVLKIPGANLPGVMTSRDALDMDTLPESVAIIGGGVIGMEFAFILSALGSQVTVVEFLDDVLSILDEDVRKIIAREAKKRKIKLLTKAKVTGIQSKDSHLSITYEQKDQTLNIQAEKVLMCVGRKPATDHVDWDRLGISFGKNGGIITDDFMRTTAPNVYAIGDVTGGIQLAHVASHQGFVAIDSLLGNPHRMSYHNIPSVIFTQPEIAVTGLCEQEAQHQNIPYLVSKFPFVANGKALADGETAGFVKVLYHETEEYILGGSIIGSNASDLIAIIGNLVEQKTSFADAKKVIYAHPTRSEGVYESIKDIFGEAIHQA